MVFAGRPGQRGIPARRACWSNALPVSGLVLDGNRNQAPSGSDQGLVVIATWNLGNTELDADDERAGPYSAWMPSTEPVRCCVTGRTHTGQDGVVTSAVIFDGRTRLSLTDPVRSGGAVDHLVGC